MNADTGGDRSDPDRPDGSDVPDDLLADALDGTDALDGADALDEFEDLGIDVDAITDEELIAQRRLSSIEAGRRQGGTMGAAMAGAMLAISEIYEGPKRDEMVAVSESPDDPTDIDKDGIRVDVGDVSVESKPPERPESPNQST